MCYLEGLHPYINQKVVKYLQREQIRESLITHALIEWTQESHQISQQFACGATEDFI